MGRLRGGGREVGRGRGGGKIDVMKLRNLVAIAVNEDVETTELIEGMIVGMVEEIMPVIGEMIGIGVHAAEVGIVIADTGREAEIGDQGIVDGRLVEDVKRRGRRRLRSGCVIRNIMIPQAKLLDSFNVKEG